MSEPELIPGVCRHCGGVDSWHHDLTECVARLKSELTAARAVIDAAEDMREHLVKKGNFDDDAAVEPFDAAMAEWRRVKG